MQQRTQIDLTRKLIERIERGETELGETEQRWPVSDYTDPARFSSEYRAIRQHPNIVAHCGQVARSGDFITKNVMGMPLLILRADDGKARVFLNVCRHRGSNLVTPQSGSRLSHIVCPYHGWTYGTDGCLRGVPDKKRAFPALEMERSNLVALPSEERHGFIWTTLSAKEDRPVPSVSEFLGSALDDEIAAYGYSSQAFYRFETWNGNFNWKCGVEQFLEIYHFPYLHRKSTDYIFNAKSVLCDRFGKHMRVIVPKKSLSSLSEPGNSDWTLRQHATILYTIFPLSVFFIEKHLLSLLQIFPESANRSRVDVTYVVDNGDVRQKEFWETNIKLFKAAIVEDLEMCEVMQNGFLSGGYSHVVFGRSESGLQQYRESLDAAIAADL